MISVAGVFSRRQSVMRYLVCGAADHVEAEPAVLDALDGLKMGEGI
jgi:hypothetical protein